MAVPVYASSASAQAGVQRVVTETCGDPEGCILASSLSRAMKPSRPAPSQARHRLAARNSASLPGKVGFTETFSNITGSTQNYFANFLLFPGGIGAGIGSSPTAAAEAGIDAKIRINGTTVWGVELIYDPSNSLNPLTQVDFDASGQELAVLPALRRGSLLAFVRQSQFQRSG